MYIKVGDSLITQEANYSCLEKCNYYSKCWFTYVQIFEYKTLEQIINYIIMNSETGGTFWDFCFSPSSNGGFRITYKYSLFIMKHDFYYPNKDITHFDFNYPVDFNYPDKKINQFDFNVLINDPKNKPKHKFRYSNTYSKPYSKYLNKCSGNKSRKNYRRYLNNNSFKKSSKV